MIREAECVWCAVQLGSDIPPEVLKDHASADDAIALAGRRGDKRDVALAARGLLRLLLLHMTGRADWQICPDPRGKPFLCDGGVVAGPHISLSHSGAWVAVAVSPLFMLGIDVEVHKVRDFQKLATYAFGPQEAQVAHNGAADFYRLWTLREAMGKWDGQGLRRAANGRDEIGFPQNTGAWQDGAWNVFSCALTDASLAIATQGAVKWRGETIIRLAPADIIF